MKRSPIKRGKPLKRMSDKRRKAMAERVKAGPVCELTPLLERVQPKGWDEYKRIWAGHPEAMKLDPHHVFLRSNGDDPRLVVTVTRVAHEFCHGSSRLDEGGTRVGRLLCVAVLIKAGRWDREFVRQCTGKDQWGEIENDYANGIFTGNCRRLAKLMLSNQWLPES